LRECECEVTGGENMRNNFYNTNFDSYTKNLKIDKEKIIEVLYIKKRLIDASPKVITKMMHLRGKKIYIIFSVMQ
jgi:hypothetical protein